MNKFYRGAVIARNIFLFALFGTGAVGLVVGIAVMGVTPLLEVAADSTATVLKFAVSAVVVVVLLWLLVSEYLNKIRYTIAKENHKQAFINKWSNK